MFITPPVAVCYVSRMLSARNTQRAICAAILLATALLLAPLRENHGSSSGSSLTTAQLFLQHNFPFHRSSGEAAQHVTPQPSTLDLLRRRDGAKGHRGEKSRVPGWEAEHVWPRPNRFTPAGMAFSCPQRRCRPPPPPPPPQVKQQHTTHTLSWTEPGCRMK